MSMSKYQIVYTIISTPRRKTQELNKSETILQWIFAILYFILFYFCLNFVHWIIFFLKLHIWSCWNCMQWKYWANRIYVLRAVWFIHICRGMWFLHGCGVNEQIYLDPHRPMTLSNSRHSFPAHAQSENRKQRILSFIWTNFHQFSATNWKWNMEKNVQEKAVCIFKYNFFIFISSYHSYYMFLCT